MLWCVTRKKPPLAEIIVFLPQKYTWIMLWCHSKTPNSKFSTYHTEKKLLRFVENCHFWQNLKTLLAAKFLFKVPNTFLPYVFFFITKRHRCMMMYVYCIGTCSKLSDACVGSSICPLPYLYIYLRIRIRDPLLLLLPFKKSGGKSRQERECTTYSCTVRI